ncbi:MAG TPA: DUF1566 domain-containing protein [Candidatus Binatia bacterium]|nr:DUF1566 domain-containing protein [Candidatus Binatia bacterium]
MQRLLIVVALAACIVGSARAASRATRCRAACGGLIAACAADTAAAGYGDLTKACKQSVLKQCKRKGTAACTAYCGNGVIDPGEECDGTSFGGATCASLGFPLGGTLRCTAACTINTRRCVTSTVPACGNGVKDGPEECDGTDLGGATCASLGFTGGGTLACTPGCGFDVSGCRSQAFPATGQTTCWDSGGSMIPCAGTGHDGDTRAGATLAYVDNGDGTITDVNTRLTWEKQSNGDGSVHDIANTYTWDQVFSMHVTALNTPPCFAGHCDWRAPNLKELESLVNLENSAPAVSSAFNTGCTSPCTVLTCSCTQGGLYWSSSNLATFTQDAWPVDFSDGNVPANSSKANAFDVRAVRGGS